MVGVKICGLNDVAAVQAAVEGGATYLGFVCFPKSPRHVTPEQIKTLIAAIPKGRDVIPVAVTVKADAELLAQLKEAGVKAFQLHGGEDVARVRDVKARFGLNVIKALAVSHRDDISNQKPAIEAADMVLFDAKPPKLDTALPGGNGIAFDWAILKGISLEKPWFLSGGLGVDTVKDAVKQTHAPYVDVSSGVEKALGVKDISKIAAFLKAAKDLEKIYERE